MTYTEIRMIFIYPAIFVFGLVWALLYWARWRRCQNRCPGNLGSALLGLAVALWAGTGFLAIWARPLVGPGQFWTGGVFTLGAASVVLVLIVGVVRISYKMWHHNGDKK